jgi:hypothetical protein
VQRACNALLAVCFQIEARRTRPKEAKMNRLTAGLTLALAATLAAATPARAEPAPLPVPSGIAVPAGHKVFLIGHATGVQKYTCAVAPAGSTWELVAPQANLYDERGKLLTTHYGGPTWQTRDGSTVKGRRDSGVPVDPTAIDWLRLSAASTAAGPEGDRLQNTRYIQRINTTGGLAPAAEECNAVTAGARVDVPYTADYVFWKATES